MSKPDSSPSLFAGIDVSAASLDLATQGAPDKPVTRLRFANDTGGHQRLLRSLAEQQRGAGTVRVVVEASGVYSVDLCHALSDADEVEVMVVNPRAAKHFRQASMLRSKTDEADAAVLCAFAQRMPFTPWHPPEADFDALRQIALRQIARRTGPDTGPQALTVERSRETNRLHAARATERTTAVVTNDIEVNIRHLNRRIDELVRQAMKLVEATPELARAYELVTSVRGIAARHRQEKRRAAAGGVDAAACWAFGSRVGLARRARRAPLPVGDLRPRAAPDLESR